MKKENSYKKIVEIFTRNNKRIKVDIREMYREIRYQLEKNLGFSPCTERREGYIKKKYPVPTNWYVILEFEEHDDRPVHQSITLTMEHFGERVSPPHHRAELMLLIEKHGLEEIEHK